MDLISDFSHTNVIFEFPGDQPPATSDPDPRKEGQQAPLNPKPEVPGTDAPEIVPGSDVEPQEQEGDEKDLPTIGPD